MPKNQSNNGLAEPLLLLLVVFLEGKLLFFKYFKTVRVRNKLMYIKNKRNSRFPKKTRKNAIVEYLDYQIPVTQLYGDMQAAKRD